MIGHHSGNQDRLFYAFNLDDHVPSKHLLRVNDWRKRLSPFYSRRGRPSIDPERMIRMLIIGVVLQTGMGRYMGDPRCFSWHGSLIAKYI